MKYRKILLAYNGSVEGKRALFEAADLADAKDNDGQMAADAVKTLKALKAAGNPFFLGIGFWRPHMPLVCPKKYWEM